MGCVDCDVLTVAVLFGWWIDFMSSGVLVDAVEAGKKSIAVVKAAMPAGGGSGGGDLNVDIKNPPVSKEKEKGKEKKKDKKTKKEKDEEEDDIDTEAIAAVIKDVLQPKPKIKPSSPSDSVCIVCKKPGKADEMYAIHECKKHSLVHHKCIKCSCCSGVRMVVSSPPQSQHKTTESAMMTRPPLSSQQPPHPSPSQNQPKRVDFESILKECKNVTDEEVREVVLSTGAATYFCTPQFFEISVMTKK